MKRIILFVIFFLALNSIYSYATPGCVVGGAYVYNFRDGSYGSVPNFRLRDPQSSYRVPVASYCVRNVGATSNSCYVTSTASGTSSAYGTLVDYGPLPCPIDDYTPLMILGLAGLGVLTIKKKHLF